MRVTQVYAAAFKGRSFKQRLAGVTVLVGDNFAGKSARAEALALALLGYLPGVAKKPNEIHERLASGPAMGVGLELDDGSAVHRGWDLQRGSVKYKGRDGAVVPALGLDPDEFLGASGPERVRQLFRLAALPAGFDLIGVRDQIVSKFKAVRIEPEHGTKHEAAIRKIAILANGEEAWQHAGVEGSTPQDWIAGFAEELAGRRKAAALDVDRHRKAVQSAAQLGESEPAPADAEQVLAQRRAALQERTQAHARLAAELESCRNGWKEAELVVKRGEKSAADKPALLRKVSELTDEVNALDGRPTEAKPADHDPSVPWTVEEAQARFEDKKKARDSAMLENAKAGDRVSGIQSELAEIDALKCCPCCEQKATKKVKDKMGQLLRADLAEAEKEMAKTLRAYESAQSELEKSSAWLDAARRRRADSEQLRTACAELEAARASLRDADALDAARAKRAELKAKGERLAGDERTAHNNLELAREALALAEDDNKRLLAQRAADAARAKAAEAAEEAGAELAVLKAAERVVADLRKELVRLSVGPIVERANALFRGVLRAPLELADGELRMGGATHRTFSGTERALAYCALTVALASASGSKIRIAVLDEMGRLDARNKASVLARVCMACEAGDLDQALLIDVEAPGREAVAAARACLGDDFLLEVVR